MVSNVVKLDDETYKTLRKIKEQEGIPMTQFIKRAVIEYAKKRKV